MIFCCCFAIQTRDATDSWQHSSQFLSAGVMLHVVLSNIKGSDRPEELCLLLLVELELKVIWAMRAI